MFSLLFKIYTFFSSDVSSDDRIEVIKMLLNNPYMDVNSTSDKQTLLQLACVLKDKALVRLLISDERTDINAIKDDVYPSALHILCEDANNQELVLLLIERGAKLDLVFNDRTPLDIAYSYSNLEIVKIIISNLPDIYENELLLDNCSSCLNDSLDDGGHLEIVIPMVSKFPYLSNYIKRHSFILLRACAYDQLEEREYVDNQLETVRYLISIGFCVNEIPFEGDSSLGECTLLNILLSMSFVPSTTRIEIIKVLLRAGGEHPILDTSSTDSKIVQECECNYVLNRLKEVRKALFYAP